MGSARAKEVAFLLYAMAVAAAYGVAHDQVTATISPEYFLLGKGLAESPEPFRWAVTWLAIRASCGTGLLIGVALLVANNPRRRGRTGQLPYPTLLKLSLLPVALATVAATVGGLVNSNALVGRDTAAAIGVAPSRLRPFVTMWAIHAGSYAGALLGAVVSVVIVVVRRRKKNGSQTKGSRD